MRCSGRRSADVTARRGRTRGCSRPEAATRLAARRRCPNHATPAAALVLLYPLDDAPHVLLTVRAGRLGKHAGQVSFPGGLIDAGESVRDAALREAFEEVGLDDGGGAAWPVRCRRSTSR